MMWIQLGLAGGAVLLAMTFLKRTWRRRNKPIDVGPVSDAWLAEQRARTREPHY